MDGKMGLGGQNMYSNNRRLLSSQYADKIFTSKMRATSEVVLISANPTSEGVSISANPTAEGKLFSSGWVLHMKWALLGKGRGEILSATQVDFNSDHVCGIQCLPLDLMQLLWAQPGTEATRPLGYLPPSGSRRGSSARKRFSQTPS